MHLTFDFSVNRVEDQAPQMTSLQTATLEEIRDFAAQMCREYLTGRWKVITTDQLIVKRISGGLSNFLYYVGLPADDWSSSLDNSNNTATECCNLNTEDCHNRNDVTTSPEPRQVLLRIYGQTHGADALEGMITESVVFALLSERNFGPKLYGIFPGGRIEQYIPARPLKTRELADERISIKVAQKMGEIHGLNIPMSKEPVWIWSCMERWQRSKDELFQTLDCDDSNPLISMVKNVDFSAEIAWLKSTIEAGSYPVMFCHNDLQEGNILLCDKASTHKTDNAENESLIATSTSHDGEPDLKIIDFEYCAYNYRGFDLANHFIEWVIDYSNPNFPYFHFHKHQYPSKEQRRKFITSYLKQFNGNSMLDEPAEEDVDNVEQEIKLFTMFTHLFWSLWSVVNVISNIEFGYWEYAAARIAEYRHLKEEYIQYEKL